MSKTDISAVKSVLGLCFSIVAPILKEYRKDGFQYTDLLAFLGSEEFKNNIAPTIQGIPDIGAEFKDFTAEEGFELAGFALDQCKLIFEALKKTV